MKIVPLELRELNELVEKLHRHHKKVVGHRFSIGCTKNGIVVGGCSVGRPVSRGCNAKTTLEVTRLVTDGTHNACSFLYAHAAKIGKAMGYKKIQTYILEVESGKSLIAAGWKFQHITRGGHWVRSDGSKRRTDQPVCKKQLWIKMLVQEESCQ